MQIIRPQIGLNLSYILEMIISIKLVLFESLSQSINDDL